MVDECVSIEDRGEAESGCSNRCHFGKVKSFLEGLNVFLKTLIVFLILSEYLVSTCISWIWSLTLAPSVNTF